MRQTTTKKIEYYKREHECQELIVTTFGCFIGMTKKGVTVKSEGRIIHQKPANELRHIVITGQGITLSSNLITYCCENNISIDFFNRGYHSGSIISNRHIQESLWQQQRECPVSRRMLLAAAIIKGKLKNQLNLIKYFNKYHKSKNPHLGKYLEKMIQYVGKVDFSCILEDLEPEDKIAFITSKEAQGAIRYWSYIRQLLLDDGTRFDNRERKGATDLVNCMLNYGYAILYSRVWQAILKARLNPFDSLIHVRQSGKPTFVFDVIEMFRAQAVDRVVISLIQKGKKLSTEDGLLDSDTKGLLAKSVLERLGRYETYRGERLSLEQIITRQATEIAAYFCGEVKTFRPYIAKW